MDVGGREAAQAFAWGRLHHVNCTHRGFGVLPGVLYWFSGCPERLYILQSVIRGGDFDSVVIFAAIVQPGVIKCIVFEMDMQNLQSRLAVGCGSKWRPKATVFCCFVTPSRSTRDAR